MKNFNLEDEKLHEATNTAIEEYAEYTSVLELDPETVEVFAVDVLYRSDMHNPDNPPAFQFDIPDDSEITSMVDPQGEIHLNPNILNLWTILSGLAHWKTPDENHNALFPSVFTWLVHNGIGLAAAETLIKHFDAAEIPVMKSVELYGASPLKAKGARSIRNDALTNGYELGYKAGSSHVWQTVLLSLEKFSKKPGKPKLEHMIECIDELFTMAENHLQADDKGPVLH